MPRSILLTANSRLIRANSTSVKDVRLSPTSPASVLFSGKTLAAIFLNLPLSVQVSFFIEA